ncbi:MAG: chitobiase/beta-hexosaminidase C-terminal domain-containing protein, partial [Bryobacteraceae bacterium]
IETNGCPGYPQHNVTVARNVIICKTGPIHVGGSDAIGTYYAQDVKIYGNVVMGGCQTGTSTSTPRAFALNAYSKNLQIYNNTLVGVGRGPDNRGYIGMLFPPGSSGIVKNNIFKNYPVGISGTATEDYNVFDIDVSTPSSNGVTRGGHSKSKTSPKFMVNPPLKATDVKLQSTSPAIRGGANLGSAFGSILSPLGVASPFGTYDQSLGWMMGAFGYAFVSATPTFSPVAGTYSSTQSVSISTSSVGAAIYYTTNGTTPTTSSSVYTGPIPVSATTIVQAIAAGGTFSASPVVTATYVIQ